jgi:hypothetical protein
MTNKRLRAIFYEVTRKLKLISTHLSERLGVVATCAGNQ